ncbi:MAG TPA: endopeptidase La [Acidimicrobiales bacterium]|nr:endopeptidase La [Acidimicrobiales bacterium]
MSSLATSALPLLPLDAGVVLPGMTITIALETPEARDAAAAAAGASERLVLVPRLGSTGDGSGRFSSVGTVASVERRGALPGGTPALVVTGLQRVTLGAAAATGASALWVSVEPATEPPVTELAREQARELRAVFEAIAEHRGLGRAAAMFGEGAEPGSVADTAGYWPELSLERKVELLETVDGNRRVELVLGWARDALAELELKDRIRSDVAEGMERTQREYLLRQQLAAIRRELGDDGDGAAGDDYRSRLEATDLPEAARNTVAKEIERLERTGEQNPEHGWIRAWLDTVLDLPWGRRSEDPVDIGAARAVLDADHTGLDDVKERIIEHLAVRKLRRDRAADAAVTSPSRRDGMILALVGPPGVGKTSLGESVARATGRRFVRVALGGVRDEAEIRGHRRTYVGALPGRVVRAIKDAGTMNPVVLLDEIDKLGSDWRGDPSSALLEVLDPAQNHTFRDHYLDLDLDLSDVLFLATANFAEQIPGPLYDRMEVVRLDGYTDSEKLGIARQHLIGRQMELAGLLDGEVEVTDDALQEIIAGYTMEAGVRGLERQIGRLLRKAAARVASEPGPSRLVVSRPDIRAWLGRPRPGSEIAARTSSPGVATGLAVTGAGGDVLFVEASASEGEPSLVVTGQLGDVMQESAQIAMSYVRAHAADLGMAPGAFDHRRVHIHVPAGAVPKDGPSAGITMATALVSLMSGRAVRPEVGMTGEITLQGQVLPIGGVKQKVLAAHRAGLTEVVLPAGNEADLEDVPDSVRERMEFHLASDISEVLSRALVQETVAA